jgi:hypothetical protein
MHPDPRVNFSESIKNDLPDLEKEIKDALGGAIPPDIYKRLKRMAKHPNPEVNFKSELTGIGTDLKKDLGDVPAHVAERLENLLARINLQI